MVLIIPQKKSSAQRDRCTPFTDAVPPPGAIVLRHKSGKGIAIILYRRIGQRINFHGNGKGRHNHGTEAVHQPLNGQNPQIHDGLLHRGHQRKITHFLKNGTVPVTIRCLRPERSHLSCAVQGKPHSGRILGNHRSPGRTGCSHVEAHNKIQVKDNVDNHRSGQEIERCHRVSYRPEKGSQIIQKEYRPIPIRIMVRYSFIGATTSGGICRI